MRSLIVLGMSVVYMTASGTAQPIQPTAGVMGGQGERRYLLLPGTIQDEEQRAYRHDQTGCCRRCCDMHGAKVGVCCCVLCAVGVGVGLGYLPSCDVTEPGFNSLRDILEWLRG